MTFLFGILMFATHSSAASSHAISCFIESPCSWLDPIPGVIENSLHYCVVGIEGNSKQLRMIKSDQSGRALSPVLLKVKEVSSEKLWATNSDESISLNVSKYADFLAGGIVIKTKEAPDGLGFYISCRLK